MTLETNENYESGAAKGTDTNQSIYPDFLSDMASMMAASRKQQSDYLVAFAAPPEQKEVTLTPKDYDKIGPKAKEILVQNGVESITVTPQPDGSERLTFKFAKPIEIPQDQAKDNCKKLIIDKELSATVHKGKDGAIVADNIQGLSALAETVVGDKTAKITKLEMRQQADGQTQIKSSAAAQVGPFTVKQDNTRVQPKEVMEKANLLFDRLHKLITTKN